MLTPLIEYLLALERPGAGHLVKYAWTMIRVPVFPPGIIVEVETRPLQRAYATIGYYGRFSPSMVPDSFTIRSTHAGIVTSDAVVDAIVMAEGMQVFILITNAQPIRVTLENVSGLNQYFARTDSNLIISSKNDLELVEQAIRKYGHSEGTGLLTLIDNALEGGR